MDGLHLIGGCILVKTSHTMGLTSNQDTDTIYSLKETPQSALINTKGNKYNKNLNSAALMQAQLLKQFP
jgi:hypothetical protein